EQDEQDQRRYGELLAATKEKYGVERREIAVQQLAAEFMADPERTKNAVISYVTKMLKRVEAIQKERGCTYEQAWDILEAEDQVEVEQRQLEVFDQIMRSTKDKEHVCHLDQAIEL